MILNILLLLVGYVAHIFLCRYLDLKAVKGRESWDDLLINNNTMPILWFIPVVGIIICVSFVVAVWYHNWKETPTGKQFLTGNK